MITEEQLDKIDLLDTLFGALDVDQLREIVNSEQIVAKLKGTNQNPQILSKLIQENSIMILDITTLKNEIYALKSDIYSIVKVLHADVFNQQLSPDFKNLKSKHGIY